MSKGESGRLKIKGQDAVSFEVYKRKGTSIQGDPKKNTLTIEIRIRTLRERKWTVYHSM